jgi:chemotaxis signal transduction protein
MKDKRTFESPSNKIINKSDAKVAELLEFILYDYATPVLQQKRFVVNIAKVMLVAPCPTVNPGPIETGPTIGTVLIRNQVVPLLNLGIAMGFGNQTPRASTTKDLIVLSFMGGKYGILVDKVIRIHYANWTDITAAAASGNRGVIGIVVFNEEPVSLIDLEGIIREAYVLESGELDSSESIIAGTTIALIDDSPVVRELVRNSFAKKGVVVETYPSAVIFLQRQLLNFKNYGDLVVDIEMPGMDGLSLCATIRKDTRYSKSKIYVYSSLDLPSLRGRANAAGADMYIVKHDVVDLWAAIEKNVTQRIADDIRRPGLKVI